MRKFDESVNVLITGGSGFLGRGIATALHERHPSWQISVLDIVPPSKDQTFLHRFFAVDVRSSSSVHTAFQDYKPDLVIHTAGIVPGRDKRYSTRTDEWDTVRAINYEGTRHVIDAAMVAGCHKFVYTSSCTVIADDLEHDYMNVDEKVPIGLAHLNYGRSKTLAEQYVLSPELARKGLKVCALRPCTIIGEGDQAVIGVFHDLIAKGETKFIVGDGDNIYDFMYISNAVLAHILAVENILGTATAAGHAFYISNQEPVYFWDFLAYIWAQFGHVPPRRIRIPVSLAWTVGLVLEQITKLTGAAATLGPGSVQDGIATRYSNNSKAIEILGYRPQVRLSEGVRRACEDYKHYLADTREQK